MEMGGKVTKLASKMGLHSTDAASKGTKSGNEGKTTETPTIERRVTRSMTSKLLSKKKTNEVADLADDLSGDDDLQVPSKRKKRGQESSPRRTSKKAKTDMQSKSSKLSQLGSRIKERAKSFSIRTRPASKRVGRGSKPIRKTCDICYGDKGQSYFPGNFPCGEHDVCITCIRTHINGSLDSDATSIRCLSCGEMWSASTILGYLKPPDQERYTQSVLSADPNYRKCLSPSCDFGQVHQPGLRKPIVECERCHAKSCFGHRVPWHEGETCAQYADRLITEQENETEQAKKERLKEEEAQTQAQIKRCPICDAATQKTDGCNAIFCKYSVRICLVVAQRAAVRLGLGLIFTKTTNYDILGSKCDKKFCSLCCIDMAVIYEQGNHMHKEDCKNWRQPGWDNNGDVERGLTKVGVIGDGPHLMMDPDDDFLSGEDVDETISDGSQDSLSAQDQTAQNLPSIGQMMNQNLLPLTPIGSLPPTNIASGTPVVGPATQPLAAHHMLPAKPKAI